MADGPNIKGRISLDGVEAVKQQLASLGPTGARAFGDLKAAAEKANLSPAAKGIEALHQQLGGLANTATTAFAALQGGSAGVVSALSGLVRIVGPVTAGVAALAGALIAAGTAAAENIIQTKRTAEGLGLTTNQYQVLSAAARKAGIDQDTLTQAMARFGNKVESEGQAQLKNYADALKALAGPLEQLAGHYRGLGDAAASKHIFKAPTKEEAAAIKRVAENLKGTAEESGAAVGKLPVGVYEQLAQKNLPLLKKLLPHEMGLPKTVETTAEAVDRHTAEQASTFGKMGISLVEKGKRKTEHEAFLDTLDVMKDSSKEKAAEFSRELFGRHAGPPMVPFMKQGRSVLEETQKQMEKSGTLTTPKQEQQAKDIHEAVETADRRVKAIATKVGRGVMGEMDPITGIFGKSESQKEFRDTYRQKLQEESAARSSEPSLFQRLLGTQGSAEQAIQTGGAADVKEGGTELQKAAAALMGSAEALRSSASGEKPSFSGGDTAETAGGLAAGGIVPQAIRYLARGGGSGHPGSPRGTDTVPAWLTPGEFVVTSSGSNLGNAISHFSRHFVAGGLVDRFVPAPMHLAVGGLASPGGGSAGGPAGHYTLDLRTNHGDISGLLAPDHVAGQLTQHAANRRASSTFSGGRGPGWMG